MSKTYRDKWIKAESIATRAAERYIRTRTRASARRAELAQMWEDYYFEQMVANLAE